MQTIYVIYFPVAPRTPTLSDLAAKIFGRLRGCARYLG